MRRRWAEYFEQVLNVVDVSNSNTNVVDDTWMPVLVELKEKSNIDRGNTEGSK